MEYYYSRDYLQDKFDRNENKLIVFCEVGNTCLNQEIILNEDMSIQFKCSCKKPYCEHLDILVNFIQSNYESVHKNHFFKINYSNINIYLSIPVSGSKGDLYLNEIKYDHAKNFSYHCSCGLKYTKYNRHKCKHINDTLSNIVSKFNTQKEEYDESLSITEDIQNLDIH